MTLQDEQLFGAPPDKLDGVTLSMGFSDSGAVDVVLYGHVTNRRDLMTLRVSSEDRQNTPSIIGALTPILMRASGMSVPGFRRYAWAAHNNLGRQGYEVKIERCGREPKH